MLIRFSDCDLFGHLSNIQYLKYFMDAREDHLKASYGFTLMDYAAKGVGWVVSTNQISYFRPARVNERVVMRSALVDFSPNHIQLEVQMLDEHKTHIKSTLWSKFVHVGVKDGRKTEHSLELMELFTNIKVDIAGVDFAKRMAELKTADASALSQAGS